MPRLVLPALAAVLLCLSLAPGAFAQDAPEEPDPATVPAMQSDVAAASAAADTAWILTSTALVMLMLPGLALFYGGMARRKNLLGTMMHSMVALGVVGVQWMVIGYCLAFGDTAKGIDGFLGWNPDYIMLSPGMAGETSGTLPIYLFVMFQGMFAIITAALVSGAFAERVRFGPYLIFILLWTTVVYDPLAHWVWGGGWLMEMGALDFAGGTVVHISAGFGGLAATLFLRKRIGYPEHSFHPNSIALTLLGAGILWFGWFGFNAGSAVAANGTAVNALAVTQVAAGAAGLAWVLTEWVLKGKPTALGFASGVVAGLVAITPASGFVAPGGALVIGLLAGTVCYGAVLIKPLLGYDDSLDAFGVHGVGGFLGAILTGALASATLYPDAAFVKNSLAEQLYIQAVASLAAAGYAFVVTAVLVLVLEYTIGFTLRPEDESLGLDRAVHGEVGFDYEGASLEEMPGTPGVEPRPALAPPNGFAGSKRFVVVVDGAAPDQLVKVWADMCHPKDHAPSPAFKAVYPNFTTVSGNRFLFRGGDPVTMRQELQKLLSDALNTPVSAHVES